MVLGLYAPAIPGLAGPALDPAMTQETASATVCVRGYTRDVRPPEVWTHDLKARLLAALGEPPEMASRYQLDHIVPLVLGGDGWDVSNYALQPWDEAVVKDRLERKLGCLVCAGRVPLADAQRAIAADWKAADQRWGSLVCGRQASRSAAGGVADGAPDGAPGTPPP